MDLEQLKASLCAGRFSLDEVVPLAAQAADAIESLQRELEEARKAGMLEAANAIEHLGDWCGGHGEPKAPTPAVCAKVIRGMAEISTSIHHCHQMRCRIMSEPGVTVPFRYRG